MYKYITEMWQFGDFLKDLEAADELGFDIETTGLDEFVHKIVLMQVEANDTIYIFDVRKLGDNLSKYIVQLINDSGRTVIGHNLKFDLKFVNTNFGELFVNVYDTMVAEGLITNGIAMDRYFSLAELAQKYCDVSLNKEVRIEFTKEDLVITEQLLVYSAEDVAYLRKIKEQQTVKLVEQKQQRVEELEMRFLPVVCSMELNGVLLNQETWTEIGGKAFEKAEVLRKELLNEIFDKIFETKTFGDALQLADFLKVTEGNKAKRDKKLLAEITEPSFIRSTVQEKFNINSSDQMLIVLRDVYGAEIKDTNEKTLNKVEMEYPIIKKLFEYREYAKVVSTYGEKFLKEINPITGRIHTTFNQLGMVSGRISSVKPNLQNIPKGSAFRNAFVARKGYKIISIDFSQEELRLLASFAKVKKMIEAFAKGIDLHLATASGLFKVAVEFVTKDQRARGKSMNFAVGYGSTEYGLWKNFGIPMEEGRELLRKFYRELYPEIDMAKQVVLENILKVGYSTTMLGRKRFFNIPKFFPGGTRERERVFASIGREGFNHIIQGTGAEVLKKSLCRIFYENPYGKELRILIQIYDEIVCEAREDIAEEAKEFISSIMLECETEYLKGIVPAEVDAQVNDYWVH